MSLKDYNQMSVGQQTHFKHEILNEFQKFLQSNPSEKEWGEQVHGIVLFPEMLYLIYRGPE